MRPPRIVIIVAFFVTSVFLTFLSLRSSHPSHSTAATSSTAPKTGIQGFFAFRAAFSLFPPNAIIALTHDNTTVFQARPAHFGPLLPADGLKGQVWIGSGFGDDSIKQGAVATSAEGELGCSDVPGWSESFVKSGAATSEAGKTSDGKSTTITTSSKAQRRSIDQDGPFDDRTAVPENSAGKDGDSGPSVDDGTDDYLHHPLPESSISKSTDKTPADSKGDHADIQSIQEGAEITGKVVLLSRGGCGFLEKVKWAQRRGAIALIVGDDRTGGPLIQMYAAGDTSNVTIPSIFTSRTTAHILSSLIGPGNFIEDTVDENGKPTVKVQHTDKSKKSGKKYGSRPTFTPTITATKATMAARAASRVSNKKAATRIEEKSQPMTTQKPGWFRSLFFGSNKGDSKSDSSRPPSSGQLDWILVDDWKDDEESLSKKISTKPNKKAGSNEKIQKNNAGAKPASGDDFVIGVQDWRDPDLVGTSAPKDDTNGKSPAANVAGKSDTTKNESPRPTKAGKKHIGGALQEIPEYVPPLRGGSITPGSGEYDTKNTQENSYIKQDQKDSNPEGKSKGLLNTIFGEDEEDVEFLPSTKNHEEIYDGDEGDDGDECEGLWVTLIPTSGASPFLDTLLVLVVSPLVTLTVVYTLLLIRSRIRRRRWRAPKSVVERLPVRTYQTITTTGNQSPRLPSPTSSSPTTPLLQQSSPSRPRPRSRTTTGIPEPGDLIRVNSSPLQVPALPPRAPEHEKGSSDSSEWRKHMGKQIECVVCLEEYVDGVSRVMSLPCGHEFHVDCITPWLTTRRRTCPICKGDVVRSLARGSPSSPRYEPYHDDSDEDIQIQAAESVNNSSSSALPITVDEEDLEQGIHSPTPTRPRRTDRPGSWRSLLASSLGSTSRSPRPQQQEDRNR